MLLFHHDPLHSDEFLDEFGGRARDQWETMGGSPGVLELATERYEIELGPRKSQVGVGE